MKRRRNRKPIRRGLRRPFEWLGIFLGMLVLTHLTHRLLFALCDFLGATMFFFDRKGRALALENLRAVLRLQKRKDRKKKPEAEAPEQTEASESTEAPAPDAAPADAE